MTRAGRIEKAGEGRGQRKVERKSNQTLDLEQDQELDPDPESDPDPLDTGMDPLIRIRIRIKKSRINKTV